MRKTITHPAKNPSRKTITHPAKNPTHQTITYPAKASPPPDTRTPNRFRVGKVLFWVVFVMVAFSITAKCSGFMAETSKLSHEVQRRAPAPTRRYSSASVRKATPTPVRRYTTSPRATATRATLTFTVIQYSNVRSGPGTHYPAFTQIPEGTKISPNGRNADGSWIRFPINNSNGWIHAPLTTITNTSSLPILDAPPPPKPTPAPTNTRITIPSTPTPAPTPAPQPAQSGTFLAGSCRDLIEAGKVPKGGWTRDNINYTSSRDRDNDGKACDN